MPMQAVYFFHQPFRPVSRKSMADALGRHETDPDGFTFRSDDIHKPCPVAETLPCRVYPPVVSILPDTEITAERIPLFLPGF